jgi:hypothetical protein
VGKDLVGKDLVGKDLVGKVWAEDMEAVQDLDRADLVSML